MESKRMRNDSKNEKEWITLKEAAKCSIYSKRQVQKLAEKGNQRIRTKKTDDSKHILFNKIDILQYAASHPRDTILNTVWDEIEPIEGETFKMICGYDYKYFLSNKNRVIDCTNGQVLTPQPHKDTYGKETGYSYVTLRQNGKNKNETIHRLIGKLQCPNALRKNIFHHIDGDKSNNKASNILPVWQWQHDELHKILKGRKSKELIGDDRDTYNKMIQAIKEENKQKLYKIPHLDFESDDKFNYFMYVTAKGYKIYKQCGDVPLDCIVKETAEAIK